MSGKQQQQQSGQGEEEMNKDSETSPISPTTPSPTTLTALDAIPSHKTVVHSSHSSVAVLADSVESSRRASSVNLDDLLAKLEPSHSSAVRIVPAITTNHATSTTSPTTAANTVDQDALASSNNTSTSTLDKKHKLESDFIWNGRVNMVGEGFFNGTARQIGGRQIESDFEWEELLPAVLNIEGRIPPERVLEYLNTVHTAGSHDLLVIQFTPDDEKQFAVIFNYFHSRNRFAVVGNKFTAVKDMYLIALAPETSVPPLLTSLIQPQQLARDKNVIVGVLVAVNKKDSKKPRYSSVQPQPVRSHVPSHMPVTHVTHHVPHVPSLLPQQQHQQPVVSAAGGMDALHIQNLLNTLLPQQQQQQQPPYYNQPPQFSPSSYMPHPQQQRPPPGNGNGGSSGDPRRRK